MNPQPPPPSDEDLAREERELAALYRRLPNAEPDAALDARVLADADRAVARPARRRAQPWLIGLGSAAALVLVAGIAWRMQPTLQEPTLPARMPDAPAAAGRSTAPIEPTPRASTQVPMSVPAPVLRDAAPAGSAQNAGTGTAGSPASVAEPEQERAATKSEAGRTPSEPRPHAIDSERARRAADQREPPRPNPDTAPLMQPAPPPAPAAAPAPTADSVRAEALGSATRPEKVGTPSSIEALVAAARDALRQGDEEAARNHVRTLLRDYPQFNLPDDLAALVPTPNTGSH